MFFRHALLNFDGLPSLFCSNEGGGAPAGAPPPAAAPPAAPPPAPAAAPPAAAPPAPAPAPQVAADPLVPKYLSERLDEKVRATLKAAGFKAPKGQSVDQSIKEAKERYDSQRARRQKAEQERDDAAAKAAALETQLATIKVTAAASMAQLTPEQQKVVKDTAGDDPVQQLQQIAALRAFGATAAAPPAAAPLAPPAAVPPAAAPPAGGPAPVAPPASTAPMPPAAPPPAAGAPPGPAPVAPPASTAQPPAPPPPAPASQDDARATYEALQKSDPYMAADYLLNHRMEIYPDRTFKQVQQQNRK